MARVKKAEVKMPVATEIKTKPVRLDLEPELHQMLRVVAAKAGKPMAVFARDVVEKTVRELYDAK